MSRTLQRTIAAILIGGGGVVFVGGVAHAGVGGAGGGWLLLIAFGSWWRWRVTAAGRGRDERSAADDAHLGRGRQAGDIRPGPVAGSAARPVLLRRDADFPSPTDGVVEVL